jgi:hypothetical protein
LFFDDRAAVCNCGKKFLKGLERFKVTTCSQACFEEAKKEEKGEKVVCVGDEKDLERVDDEIDEGKGESSSDDETGLLVFIDPTTGDPLPRPQAPS